MSLKAAWFQYIIEIPRRNYTAPGLKCLDICLIFNIVSAIPRLRKKMTSQWRDEQVKSGKKKYFILIVFAATMLSCAQQRPVLYPNAHLKQVAKETAESDIDDCLQLAIDYGAKEDSGAKVAKDTAKGAAVGGAAGTAVGAVTGNLGRGAAAGAAGGGAASMTRSMINSGKPGPVFKKFVDQCLRDKGYQPVGWR